MRQIVAPNGKHRPRRLDSVPPTAQPRPVEATETTVNDTAYCPAEKRDRLHAFLRTGGRVCWTCRTVTLHGPFTSAPHSGGTE
ncbi:hypothetical protein DIZ27_23230 [Streptomyces sp. NWU339]|nr:hypothetical protein DIZ27_23230 [Streptomyces sp. NWU339]